MSDLVLSRSAYPARAAAPVRIVHLGLGAFHRAHQAWYTDRVDTGAEWGIAAFTGRSPAAAEQLAAQDGLYTLVVRSEHGDQMEVVQSISEAADGADVERLCVLVAQPDTALITLTITESGYYRGAGGEFDRSDPSIEADLYLLRGTKKGAALPRVTTAIARLTVALDARRRAGSGPIAVVSCDNVSHNGDAVRRAMLAIAEDWDPGCDGRLFAWLSAEVSFVSSSVDRITPRTTSEDLEAVQSETGLRDDMAVVTEPFSNWILAGDFPAGRPNWEHAGALFVEDIDPFENRKLWMLNGAHSLMAYAGSLRGSSTVHEAFADHGVRTWVEDLWQLAARHLSDDRLDLDRYLHDVRDRFRNPRIAHHLAQIATDGSGKLRNRAVPLVIAERAAGRSGRAMLRVVAAWIAWLDSLTQRCALEELRDSAAAAILSILLGGPGPRVDRISGLLGLLEPAWGSDRALQALVRELVDDIARSTPTTPTSPKESA